MEIKGGREIVGRAVLQVANQLLVVLAVVVPLRTLIAIGDHLGHVAQVPLAHLAVLWVFVARVQAYIQHVRILVVAPSEEQIVPAVNVARSNFPWLRHAICTVAQHHIGDQQAVITPIALVRELVRLQIAGDFVSAQERPLIIAAPAAQLRKEAVELCLASTELLNTIVLVLVLAHRTATVHHRAKRHIVGLSRVDAWPVLVVLDVRCN